MKVGIFFGGPSREREVSFAGGRTVYDNLNKSIFEPVPIFVDSLGNFILLDWQFIYKGTIRDFYPPVAFIPDSPNHFQVYVESLGNLSHEELEKIAAEVGRIVAPWEFKKLFEFAFLCLHGPYGEDGSLQGLLEWYKIPYSGSGILPSAIGINKIIQSSLSKSLSFAKPVSKVISKDDWLSVNKKAFFEEIATLTGLPVVVKAAQQGSSIGVSIVSEKNFDSFIKAVNRALFVEEVEAEKWNTFSKEDKVHFIHELIDIRQGIGLPVFFSLKSSISDIELIYHPEELLNKLDKYFNDYSDTVVLQSRDSEEAVLFESFIKGQEFSCIVIQDENGEPVALPPTEIIKFDEVFDYRSKYLPGMSRKLTPVNTSIENIRKIQDECCEMFRKLKFNVYARIDGFLSPDNQVYLNDPNTTSGMLPSSFFFHQAAEIGLNPSQFLTYIIRTSLAERIKSGKNGHELKKTLNLLDEKIIQLQQEQKERVKVAVIMGGYSSERHISIESGRNIFEKIAASEKYEAIPIFLTGDSGNHELYLTPINIMLKDNADDIKDKIHKALTQKKHAILKENVEKAEEITRKYVGRALFEPEQINYDLLKGICDAVFIALHGRPGEDGEVQKELEARGIPYNGSDSGSSTVTIDKYRTNQILRENGISVANHRLILQDEWENNEQGLLEEIEKEFSYPLIAKPSDDGCSSAVKKIKNREQLDAFIKLMFRKNAEISKAEAAILKLQKNEEFPFKSYFLIEELIEKNDADHFLEVTGGLLTHMQDGEVTYEVFEPSEALASGDVLSLEEKFLAGEGQNITPARFSKDKVFNNKISAEVRKTLKKTAEILNVQGYARIDAFVRIYPEKTETIIIEVNSLPGMTPATCIFHQCALNNYKPYDFIDKILEYGILRQNKTKTV
ncbi:D-alanine--D-alanine ligase family protein [Chondrinema litorale]|uniref:D-alanine--D-alanine ligase family protein n=1 Tax=Chondrinema litorale TaxID=2994555 RepID=UPI002543F7A3|nr:D-alanine--D-alanine ligase [Chondrinema litorale]UZR94294.1 D-alanine--D-alanine ligase [Chondrinema litorale]